MTTSYQLATQNGDKAKFVSVDASGVITELLFTNRIAQVPVAGNRRVPMVSESLTLIRAKDVSCGTDPCGGVTVPNNVKITLTAVKRDSAALDAMLSEAQRVLGVWRSSLHADDGLLPPGSSTFTV